MKYSSVKDIQDELIKQYSKASDHKEAEEYVDKVLTKLHVNINSVVITPLIRQLSITYATYKRSFYESHTRGDIFFQKYLSYEKELRDLTGKLIRTTDQGKELSAIFQSKEPIDLESGE